MTMKCDASGRRCNGTVVFFPQVLVRRRSRIYAVRSGRESAAKWKPFWRENRPVEASSFECRARSMLRIERCVRLRCRLIALRVPEPNSRRMIFSGTFVGGDDEHRAKTANADEVSAGKSSSKPVDTICEDVHPISAGLSAGDSQSRHQLSASVRLAGKTSPAVAAAVDAFERGTVERIVLTRPAVEAGERSGFLPGIFSQKVDPYLRPLYDALFDLMGFDKVQRLMERQSIEVAPLAYMRGRTLNNAFVILDEAQNTTGEQMKMFLTRIGFGSKAVITGDITQIDLPRGVLSGLKEAARVLQGVRGISFTHFRSSDVVRHPLVARIVEAYDAAAVRDEIERRAEREHRKAEGTRSAEKDLHHA